jgi:molybdate transport system substrate-binding protein
MPPALVLAVPALLACLPGCTSEPGGVPPRDESVLVSAASSLTDAFSVVESAFEAANPGVDVQLNLAASSVLREQILGGAPVDVFASADSDNMERLARAGVVAGAPRAFARNRLQIAVPAGNPAAVSGLADLATEELLIGLCVARAPCGGYGDRLLAAAGVTPSLDTREPSARALLAKIEAGELDAGIVYATDVKSSSRVEGIVVPADRSLAAVYPIAVLEAAPNEAAAAAFVAFVLAGEGRAILADHGFLEP